MWEHVVTMAIGGLEEVGFATSGNIIVLSSQGRAIIDCSNGQKIFRDNKEWWNDFREEEKVITGFGSEKDAAIKIFGLHTEDFLPKTTSDGWSLSSESSFHGAIPIRKFFLKHFQSPEPIFISEDGPCEVRAYGFSSDEKTMIVATSCEVILWKWKKVNEQGI
jgi:hypothetical protein